MWSPKKGITNPFSILLRLVKFFIGWSNWLWIVVLRYVVFNDAFRMTDFYN